MVVEIGASGDRVVSRKFQVLYNCNYFIFTYVPCLNHFICHSSDLTIFHFPKTPAGEGEAGPVAITITAPKHFTAFYNPIGPQTSSLCTGATSPISTN